MRLTGLDVSRTRAAEDAQLRLSAAEHQASDAVCVQPRVASHKEQLGGWQLLLHRSRHLRRELECLAECLPKLVVRARVEVERQVARRPGTQRQRRENASSARGGACMRSCSPWQCQPRRRLVRRAVHESHKILELRRDREGAGPERRCPAHRGEAQLWMVPCQHARHALPTPSHHAPSGHICMIVIAASPRHHDSQ